MTPAACWCGRAPQIHTAPASRDGMCVATIIQCPAHVDGQVSIYGTNFGYCHAAAISGWNAYQQRHAADAQLRERGAA